MDKLYIVIPAYNERENIKTVIEQWYPVVAKYGGEGSNLVIVDDGSKDDTYEIIKNCEKNRPQLVAVTKKNEGHGATVLYAYKYALEAGADFVFQTDSDGQTNPSEFGEFWEKRYDYSMVIGYRKDRQDGKSRVFVTKTLKSVLKLCFGVTVTDANTPYRLMQADGLRENVKLIPDKFNLSNAVLSVIYEKKKMNVLYIPITFKPRQGGVNSINMKKIFKIGIHALRDFHRINKNLENI